MTFFGKNFHSLNTLEHHDYNSEIIKNFNIWLCELLKNYGRSCLYNNLIFCMKQVFFTVPPLRSSLAVHKYRIVKSVSSSTHLHCRLFCFLFWRGEGRERGNKKELKILSGGGKEREMGMTKNTKSFESCVAAINYSEYTHLVSFKENFL